MSAIQKAKGFGKSKAGTYLSIGTTLYSAVKVTKEARKARTESDTLELVHAVVKAAALATGLALLVRELRQAHSDDVLAD